MEGIGSRALGVTMSAFSAGGRGCGADYSRYSRELMMLDLDDTPAIPSSIFRPTNGVSFLEMRRLRFARRAPQGRRLIPL
jgi:hypothetical protein